MTRPLRVAVALALALASSALAADAPELPRHVFAVSADEEVEDILFLGDARPVLIRLHIRVDGAGHRGRWLDRARVLHEGADRDRDGIVSRDEATRAVNRFQNLQDATALVRQAGTRRVPPAFSNVVGVEDLAERLRAVVRPFEIERPTSPSPSNDEASFRLLDLDGDAHLSRDELARAPSSLARLDVDDDETISAEELAPYRNPTLAGQVVARPAAGPDSTPAGGGGDLVSATGQKPRYLAQSILRRYDETPPAPQPRRPPSPYSAQALGLIGGARGPTLKPRELPIDRAAFERIDSDGDGSVDSDELERAISGAFDVELIVRLGDREPGLPAIERFEGAGGASPFGAPGFRRFGDAALLDLSSTMVEIRAEPDGADSFRATRGNLDAFFRNADLNGDGFVDKDDFAKFSTLSALFFQADGDRDGRLSAAEWKAQVDDLGKLLGLRTVLRASEQGSSFLDLLDEDRDRRLGVRELRGAPGRIALEDLDGDGRISLGEFARRHRWTFARGQTVAGGPPTAPAGGRPARIGRPVDPPYWFVKMDRNRDGDLSPREFHGPRATFEELDADRDGLITGAEASKRP